MTRGFVLALLFLSGAAQGTIPASERQTLDALFIATGGAQWLNGVAGVGAWGGDADSECG